MNLILTFVIYCIVINMATNFDKMVRKCEGIAHQIDRLKDFIANNTPSERILNVKYTLMVDLRADFSKTYEKVVMESNDGNKGEVEKLYTDFDNLYNETEMILDGKLPEPSIAESTPEVTNNNKMNARLPKLDLKTFSSGYTEWAEYIEIFKCAVDKRTDLSPVNKLQYLKSTLRGEASGLVKSLSLIDSNYKLALKILEDRYNDVESIREAHLDAIFNFPIINFRTSTKLRQLKNVITEHVTGLENMGEPVEHWSSILLYIVKRKLDSDTKVEWQKKVGSEKNNTLKFTDFVTFLEYVSRALEAGGVQKEKFEIKKKPVNANFEAHRKPAFTCYVCKGSHKMTDCSRFKGMSVKDRKRQIEKFKLCSNCFSAYHSVPCTKPNVCRVCNEKHHVMLHDSVSSPAAPLPAPAAPVAGFTPPVSVSTSVQFDNDSEILLSTAIVRLLDKNGTFVYCRALIDSGSQASFCTEACRRRLSVLTNKTDIPINGIGMKADSITETFNCDVFSVYSAGHEPINVDFLVMKKVTCDLPRHKVKVDWPELENVNLADKYFMNPGHIDLLLGADVYYKLVDIDCPENLKKSPDGNLRAFNTAFGWVVTGKASLKGANNSTGVNNSFCIVNNFLSIDNLPVDVQLKKFWEIEEAQSSKRLMTPEELKCENHFVDTYQRTAEGRFVVALGFKDDFSLCNNRERALKRFNYLEKRFESNSLLKEQYASVVNEYFDLNHAEIVPDDELNNSDVFYLPHHCVTKESSSTTKLRVVFDASAKGNNGVSLNDCLLEGPKVQQDLYDILVRFRKHKVAFVSDIEKMYRQVLLDHKSADYHRFIWRVNSVIKDCRMTRVTFGIAPSSYNSQRVLKQTAIDGSISYPLASEVLETDMYMDDCLSGAENTDIALEIQSQLIAICEGAGFKLRKWASSAVELLDAVEPENRELKVNIDFETSIKTLGVCWYPNSDEIGFNVANFDARNVVVSKRLLISETSKIFDPYGLISPVLMVAKVMFQNLWEIGVSWDDPLPKSIQKRWLKWRVTLCVLSDLKLNRCLVPKNDLVVSYELHGFADASELGYGGSVYLRTVTKNGKVCVELITAKTKVAPLKKVNVPRLELCGALKLASLLDRVLHALMIPDLKIVTWSDSTVALAWIRGNPNRWKTFVANRVSEIQGLVSPSVWRHCPTEDNPFDCASRGLYPEELIEHRLWWHGPQWLFASEENWPVETEIVNDKDVQAELKKNALLGHVVIRTTPVLNIKDFSDLDRLQRITAWCFRWLTARTTLGEDRVVGVLKSHELDKALNYWIVNVQREHFSDEILRIQNKESVLNRSRLRDLCPFLDENGLLRVGGRLLKADVSKDKKFPLVLPGNCRLSELIIDAVHKRNLHCGPQQLIALLRERFWILRARDVVRKYLHKCVTCRRNSGRTLEQVMGVLPADRVTPSRVFSRCGIDYCGPIQLKVKYGRRSYYEKAWIALFVCFATKAVHLELVTSLSSEAFIATLKRFVSRRGKPAVIYSDNGTNFTGAQRELKELRDLLKSEKHNDFVTQYLSTENIEWKFSPQTASHFGGLWEANIKRVRYHLRRIVGDAKLTFEETSTVLCQIEAVLNSRPLTPLSNDASDLSVLTPGHFLIGAPLVALPEPDLTDLKVNTLSRWQYTQVLVQHFWKRWSSEYLAQMNTRVKWLRPKRNLEVGDLVTILQENLPALKWPLGRVISVNPGVDGKVRVVSVKTQTGVFKRPIAKLALILNNDDLIEKP